MPEGSAPIDASYALSAWIDTKFWHHKSERGGDGSSVGSACLRAQAPHLYARLAEQVIRARYRDGLYTPLMLVRIQHCAPLEDKKFQ